MLPSPLDMSTSTPRVPEVYGAVGSDEWVGVRAGPYPGGSVVSSVCRPARKEVAASVRASAAARP
jgi:hypothetical protein